MASPTPPTTFVSQAFRGQRLAKQASKMKPRGSFSAPKLVPKWLLEASGPLGRHVGSRSLPGRLAKRFRSSPGPEKNSLPSPGGAPEKFPSEISPSQGGPGGPGAHFGPPFGDWC